MLWGFLMFTFIQVDYLNGCVCRIFGFDEFPTNKKELDILKFKAKSVFNTFLLRDSNDLD